jgi:Ca-activated chloride channel homolog
MTAFTYAKPQPRLHGRPAEALFERLVDNLLDQGSLALRPLRSGVNAPGERSAQMRLLLDEGYLRLANGATDLGVGPRGVAACEARALLELLGPVGGVFGASRTESTRRTPGAQGEPGEFSRPLLPGEPLDHIDLHATLRNALTRAGMALPLPIHPDDIEVRPPEPSGRRATVVLLDRSASMDQYGKFAAARRTALALRTLVQRRFPDDTLRIAGFATRVHELTGPALLEVGPVPVGLVEKRARARAPAADAFSGRSVTIPEHFTNIHAALRWARLALRREAIGSRQIVLITDGEPTAHLEGGELVLEYPAGEASVMHTLTEARRCAAEGIALSVYALLTDRSSDGLRAFVADLARAGRGTAVCCPAGGLGSRVLLRFLRPSSSLR